MIKRWFVYSAAGTIVSCTTIPSTAAITDTSIILINSTVTTSTTNIEGNKVEILGNTHWEAELNKNKLFDCVIHCITTTVTTSSAAAIT